MADDCGPADNDQPSAVNEESHLATRPFQTSHNHSADYLQEEAAAILEVINADEQNNGSFFFTSRNRHYPFIMKASYFRVPHECPPSLEDDPLVGIFKEFSVCCAMRDYLDLPVDIPMAEVRCRLTRFGQKLIAIGTMFEIQVDNMAADYWMLTDRPVDGQVLGGMLKATVNHTDEDKVTWAFDTCLVCYGEVRFVRKPPCCRRPICQPCWQQYVKTFCETSKISYELTGAYNLRCYGCDKLVPYSEALASSEPEVVELFRPRNLLADDQWSARCPVCLTNAPPVAEEKARKKHPRSAIRKLRRIKGGHPCTCLRCGHSFCRLCGNANHSKLSCDQFVKSEAGLLQWSKQKGNFFNPDFRNGRSCPFCSVMISHAGGCPHMKCPCCRREFCYSCGRKYYDMPFLRSHSSTKLLPFISCPKQWKSTGQRVAIHSLISAGFFVAAAPLVVTLAPIALPAALVCYLIRKRKQQKNSIVF